MDYDEWIEREKRIRVKILLNSPAIFRDGLFRVCEKCREICLCHEEKCPNCDSDRIVEEKLNNAEDDIKQHIRCRFRYHRIFP